MASSEINPRDVVDALETLTHDQTKELFFHLGVDLHVMSNLASDYKGNMCRIHIVQTWFDKGVEVNWNAIIAGLKKIKMNALADSVASQHNVECTDTVTSDLTNPPVPPQATGVTQSTITTTSVASDENQPLTAVVSSASQVTVTKSVPVHPVIPVAPTTVSTESGPSGPLVPYQVTGSTDSTQKEIKYLQDTFTDVISDTQLELSDKESQDRTFFTKFRAYLMFLPASNKAIHVKFFRDSENDFMEAKNTLRLFAILSHLWI